MEQRELNGAEFKGYDEKARRHEAYLERKRASKRRWYQKNKEKAKEQVRKYLSIPENKKKRKEYQRLYNIKNRDILREKYRPAQRDYWLKSNYGLSTNEYELMLVAQGRRCAVCNTTDWGKRGPEVDHNHTTGKIRGILCRKCNAAIAMIDDNPERAILIANYLRERDNGN